MTPRTTSAPLDRFTVSGASWDLLWSHVHRVLILDLGLVATGLPLLAALLAVRDPWHYPAFFGLLAVGAGPSLAAAFGYLQAAEQDPVPPVLAFARAYRQHARRALVISGAAVAASCVLVVDVVTLAGTPAGPALVPLMVVLLGLTVSSAVTATALLVRRPEADVRAVLRAGIYATVRRPHLAAFTLGVMLAGAGAVNQVPVAGLCLVPGCLAVVTWVNARYLLDRALQVRPAVRVDPAR